MAFDFENNISSTNDDNFIDSLFHVSQKLVDTINQRINPHNLNYIPKIVLQSINGIQMAVMYTDDRLTFLELAYIGDLYEILKKYDRSILYEFLFNFKTYHAIFEETNTYKELLSNYMSLNNRTITIKNIDWFIFLIQIHQNLLINNKVSSLLHFKLASNYFNIAPFNIKQLSEFVIKLKNFNLYIDDNGKDYLLWRDIKNFVFNSIVHNKMNLPKSINNYSKFKTTPIKDLLEILTNKTALKKFI